MDDDEDYESIRRRQAEERRKKREQERQNRRAKLKLPTRLKSSVALETEPTPDILTNSVCPMSRKRSRVSSDRIEKLKENKRTEEGIKLMAQMFGVQYLKSDDLFTESPGKMPAKESSRAVHDDVSLSPLSEDLAKDSWSAPRKSAARSSGESRNGNRNSFQAKSTQSWQTCSSASSQPKRKPLVKGRTKSFSNRDSSSDEDLVALAQRLEQKKKCLPSQRMNASLKKKIRRPIQPGKGENKYNCDGDLTNVSPKDDTRRVKDANCYESNDEHDISNLIYKSKREKRRKKAQSDSESEVEDLFAYSRKLHRQTKNRHEYESDSSGSNDEMRGNTNVKKYMSEEKKDITDESPKKPFPSVRRNVQNDELWDDSEEEYLANVPNKSSYDEKINRSGRSKKGAAGHRRSFEKPESDIDEFEDNSKLEKQLKPFFENPKWEFECEPFVMTRSVIDDDDIAVENVGDNATDKVPAAINRYLKDYQKEGVRFLHSAVTSGLGAVLGDDMGVGKTVQVISLIAALQKKTGTNVDLKVIKERYRVIEEVIEKEREEEDLALLQGGTVHRNVLSLSRPYSPILIIVPPSVLTNWENELKCWGHFAVASYRDSHRAQALNRVKIGCEDILLCGKSMLSQKKFFPPLLEVEWKLIIIDEFHEYKNSKSATYKSLEELRNSSACPLIGMTGTLMSNAHRELYTLIDLVQLGLLGTWKEFQREYSRPIMLARTKDAKPDVLRLGKQRSEELQNVLTNVYLRRDKSVCLEDDLPTKNQKVIFCKLSDIQKRLYKHIIYNLPEYELLRKCSSPCDCGVNKDFFLNYSRLPSKAQKLDYYRRHKKSIIPRKKCCYQIPVGDRVVLWPSQHLDGQPCKNCPTCILLPALNILYKLCSHSCLLQAERHPDTVDGEKAKEKAEKDLAFARVAIPDDVLTQLPGGLFRQSSVLSNHSMLSGKMKTLGQCLKKFEKRRDRVLLFSYSTITLDLIQQYIKTQGYSHLRLDGSTPTSKRQALIDTYQQNESIFLFLISTKAGGMGLNLTAANRVIIYDVNWNPSHDEQAQDRSYRIGQERDVEVIRLVAEGTIEEQKYLRQVYKVHLKQQTLQPDDYTAGQPARIFRGVDKDKNRKGELFGVENLLKFKDGSFMESLWKATSAVSEKGTGDSYNVGDLAGAMQTMPADLLENEFEDANLENTDINEMCDSENEELKGFNHEDFLREDRGDAAVRKGDEGYDEEMGAGSQLVHLACEEIDDPEIESKDGAVPKNSVDVEAALLANLGSTLGLIAPKEEVVPESSANVEAALLPSVANTTGLVVPKEEVFVENSSDVEASLLANIGTTVGLKPMIRRTAIKENFAILKAALGGKDAKNFCDSSTQQRTKFDPRRSAIERISSLDKRSETLLPTTSITLEKVANVLPASTNANCVSTEVDRRIEETTKATTAKTRSKETPKKKPSLFSSKNMLYIPSYLRDKE